VSDSRFFTVLGVQPILGRTFAAEEDSIGEGRAVVILSHAFWRRRFNGDSGVIGRTLSIGGTVHTVIGVMPEKFRGMTGRAELWMPLVNAHPWAMKEAWGHSYTVVARVANGIAPHAAKAAMPQLGQIVDRAFPHPERSAEHHGAIARELDATRVDPQVRRSLYIMIGAVGLVLLIACANVANLFLVRASSRVHEIAVRLAIGATRRRLVRQLVTESMLLAFLGGVAGVGIAWAAVQVLSSLDATRAFNVRNLGGVGAVTFEGIRLDQTALAVAAALTIVTGLLFGVFPALNATRPALNQQLKNGRTPRFARSMGSINSRDVLVAVEIALAVVLLAGSGLMIRSLDRLHDVALGFDPSNTLTFRLNVREGSPPDSIKGFYSTIVQQLSALPGVIAATAHDCPPLNGGCNTTSLIHRDRPLVPEGSETEVGVHWIEPDWHTAMGVPLLAGRTFDTGDRVGSRKVVLINATAAKRLWPGQDPLGKPVSVGQGGFWNDTAYVVGIIGDLRYVTIDSAPRSDVYLSNLQSPRGRMMLMVRTQGDAEAHIPAVRDAMRDIAPGLPVYDLRTMESRVGDSTAYARFSTLLLALFAAVALALATLGAYGVIAFSVSQRTRELGIRMALGAQPGDVVRMVVRSGLVVAGIGAAIGLGVAMMSTRVLQSLLYEVTPTDPITFVFIVAILMLAVALASWVPARRAARIQPTVALREE
jgi:putative ABC transport system permease protein